MKLKLISLLAVGLSTALLSCSRTPEQQEQVTEESSTPASPASEPAPAPRITHLDAAGAAKLLADNAEITVLDVRTPGEYAEGHLAGAVNIDFRSADFEERVLGDLHRDNSYLLHCQGGGRSSAAFEKMSELGFSKLYHLDGGLSAWTEAGQPVEK